MLATKYPDARQSDNPQSADRHRTIPHDIEARQTKGGEAGLLLAEAACSLADVLRERGPMPETEVRGAAVAAAEALARVHNAGLMHGDVKPANLLLSREGDLWLADFDSAAPCDGRPLRSGTPQRVPPGKRSATPAADVTALAMTLIELATGKLADPAVEWRAEDLHRLGCPPSLSADISLVLGTAASSSADSAAAVFARREPLQLPAPAARFRMEDPTPTVEFMPVRQSLPPLTLPRTHWQGPDKPGKIPKPRLTLPSSVGGRPTRPSGAGGRFESIERRIRDFTSFAVQLLVPQPAPPKPQPAPPKMHRPDTRTTPPPEAQISKSRQPEAHQPRSPTSESPQPKLPQPTSQASKSS